jgi:hypothetical protein
MILAFCNHLSLKFLGTGNELWFNRQMSKISCHGNIINIYKITCTWAPEPRRQRGQLPPLPKQCGGSTGATGCPFYRNCTSKFVRYSQELEFKTILKQCLRIFALFLSSCSKINAKSSNIRQCTYFILHQQIKLFKIKVEVRRPIIATSNRVSIHVKF